MPQNIAKPYGDKQFMEDLQEVLNDIPTEVISDADDLFSAVVTGMQVNYPEAFRHFSKRSKQLTAVMLSAFADYIKKHHRNFHNNGDYMEYFKGKLSEWGVSSPAELPDSQKSKFFSEVKTGK
jgi:hypothetical protein